jgi:hypothetical protein
MGTHVALQSVVSSRIEHSAAIRGLDGIPLAFEVDLQRAYVPSTSLGSRAQPCGRY